VHRDNDESFVSANSFDRAPRDHVREYGQFCIEVEPSPKAILAHAPLSPNAFSLNRDKAR